MLYVVAPLGTASSKKLVGAVTVSKPGVKALAGKVTRMSSRPVLWKLAMSCTVPVTDVASPPALLVSLNRRWTPGWPRTRPNGSRSARTTLSDSVAGVETVPWRESAVVPPGAAPSVPKVL